MNESSIHAFYFKNQPPTLSLLLVALHSVPSRPDFKMGTVYWKKQNKAIMTGRNDANE
jgi:hypothetical protein